MRWPSKPWLFWALSSSLALHSVAYASLSPIPRKPAVPALHSEVTFEVNEPEPPARTPERETEPEVEKAAPQLARPEPARIAKLQPVAHTTAAPSEPKSAAAPLDLSGVTLTNDQGSGFAVAIGNGRAFEGPIGNGRAVASRENTPSAPKAVAPAAPLLLVAASDLSARPAPPALDGALQRNYPRDAKERGVGGSAQVKARIDPDGSARQVRMENESFPGFGEACRKTLQGSRWSVPRDREGRAVATEIRYTCRFVVQP